MIWALSRSAELLLTWRYVRRRITCILTVVHHLKPGKAKWWVGAGGGALRYLNRNYSCENLTMTVASSSNLRNQIKSLPWFELALISRCPMLVEEEREFPGGKEPTFIDYLLFVMLDSSYFSSYFSQQVCELESVTVILRRRWKHEPLEGDSVVWHAILSKWWGWESSLGLSDPRIMQWQQLMCLAVLVLARSIQFEAYVSQWWTNHDCVWSHVFYGHVPIE